MRASTTKSIAERARLTKEEAWKIDPKVLKEIEDAAYEGYDSVSLGRWLDDKTTKELKRLGYWVTIDDTMYGSDYTIHWVKPTFIHRHPMLTVISGILSMSSLVMIIAADVLTFGTGMFTFITAIPAALCLKDLLTSDKK